MTCQRVEDRCDRFGFVWSDLACYVVGVGVGVMMVIGVSALKERQI
jgi:hypothetical protein